MALRAHSERRISTPVAQAIEGLALLAGVYLAASPWITGFSGFNSLSITNLILGIAFTVFTMGFVSSAYERIHSLSWAALGVGVFTIVAPWVVWVSGSFDTTRTIWSNCVVGGVMVCLALATAALGAGTRRRGRA